MKALLWKELHVNRVVLRTGAIVLLLPFLIGAGINVYAQWRYHTGGPWMEFVVFMAMYSLGLSILTIAMLGGNAMAGERADRSAEFLAYLPVSRRAVIGSKAAFAIGAGLMIWIIDLLVIYGFTPLTENPYQLAASRHEALPVLAAIAVLTFGAAWFCSSFLASPAIATVLGIGAPVVLLLILKLVEECFHLSDPRALWEQWYVGLCIGLGLAAFVAGVAYYLPRVEP